MSQHLELDSKWTIYSTSVQTYKSRQLTIIQGKLKSQPHLQYMSVRLSVNVTSQPASIHYTG